MKTKYSNKSEPNPGWNIADQWLLREYDNPQKPPQTQIFSYSEPDEDEEPQESTTGICLQCKSYDLKPLLNTGTKFCGSCSYFERPPEENKAPLEGDSPMYIPSAHKPYPPTFDENDTTVQFVVGIDVNKDITQGVNNADVELVRESPDHRIKHYRVKNGHGIVSALSVVNELEGRGQ